jgi:hypothetical protein
MSQLCWLSDCCLPAYSRFVVAERKVQFLDWNPTFRYLSTFQLPCWPLWRTVHQPFYPSVPYISVEWLTVVFTQDVLVSNIDPKTCLREGVFCSCSQTLQPISATAPFNRPLPGSSDSYSLKLSHSQPDATWSYESRSANKITIFMFCAGKFFSDNSGSVLTVLLYHYSSTQSFPQLGNLSFHSNFPLP